MKNAVKVKICGLKEPRDVAAAVQAGATYVGFNFFPRSPRYLTVDQAARLASAMPAGVLSVALTVDADDAALRRIVEGMAPDMLQLHGGESAERVAEVRARFGLPVMKAVGVA
ncbi:MAG: N-(5'-phosphoribosyl)anthranilate isomerase, partial [Paracoccaceae bacterium]